MCLLLRGGDWISDLDKRLRNTEFFAIFKPHELEMAFSMKFFALYSTPRILKIDNCMERLSPLIEFTLSPMNCHLRKKASCSLQGSVIAFSGMKILTLSPVFSFSADFIHTVSWEDFVLNLEQLELHSGADLLDQPNDFIAVVRREVPLSFARRLVKLPYNG